MPMTPSRPIPSHYSLIPFRYASLSKWHWHRPTTMQLLDGCLTFPARSPITLICSNDHHLPFIRRAKWWPSIAAPFHFIPSTTIGTESESFIFAPLAFVHSFAFKRRKTDRWMVVIWSMCRETYSGQAIFDSYKMHNTFSDWFKINVTRNAEQILPQLSGFCFVHSVYSNHQYVPLCEFAFSSVMQKKAMWTG